MSKWLNTDLISTIVAFVLVNSHTHTHHFAQSISLCVASWKKKTSNFTTFALSNFQFKKTFQFEVDRSASLNSAQYTMRHLTNTQATACYVFGIQFRIEPSWSFYVKKKKYKSHPLCTKYAIITGLFSHQIFNWIHWKWINLRTLTLLLIYGRCWLKRKSVIVKPFGGKVMEQFKWNQHSVGEHFNLNKTHIDSIIIQTQFQLTH